MYAEFTTAINPHPSICKVLKTLGTYSRQRKYLKKFGLTKSEQNIILRFYKNQLTDDQK